MHTRIHSFIPAGDASVRLSVTPLPQMQARIVEAKTKLVGIIVQANIDVANLTLGVVFTG